MATARFTHQRITATSKPYLHRKTQGNRPFGPRSLGQIVSNLAMWILLSLGAIIFIIYAGNLRQSLEKEGEIKACQYSIGLFSTADKYTFEKLKPTIRCPAPHLELGGDEEKTRRSLAEAVRTCWFKTTGRENTIASTEQGVVKSYVLDKLGMQAGDSFCILCSSFTLDKPILVSDQRETMHTASMINDQRTYEQFLDTTWKDAGSSPLDQLFVTVSKTGAIPLPGSNGKMDGVKALRLIEAGTTYYIIDYNNPQGNTVVVTAQTDAGNLACDRFLQQRESGKLLS